MNTTSYNLLTRTLTILVLSGFWACDTLLDNFEYDKKTPKLVVNAILNPDSVISIHISNSKPYNPPGNFEFLENIHVELFENDQPLGLLSSMGSGYYTLTATYPQEGATYKVVAKVQGYESVWAETTIPRKIENMEVEQKLRNINYQDGYSAKRMEYRLTYQVPLTQPVFYGTSISSQKQGTYNEYICMERETPYFNGYYYETDTCYVVDGDPLATRTEHIYIYSNSSLIKFSKGWGSYYLSGFDDENYTSKIYFSNKNYSGNIISLVVRIDYYYLFDNINNEITLWTDSFDEVLYNFMYSLAKKYEVDDDPFAEKVSVYSNVNGGLGIFGSSNSTSYVIRYDEAFMEDLNLED